MNEIAQTNTTSQIDQALKSNGRKPLWQRPTLTFLGRVRDIVKGGGKSAFNADSDPQGTLKQGIG